MFSTVDFYGRCPAALSLMAVLWLVSVNPVWAAGDSPGDRTFSFSYRTRIGPIAADTGPVHVFLPLVRENDQQRILSERIEASLGGRVEVEERYGNRYWHGWLDAADGEAIDVRIETTVVRRVFRREPPTAGSRGLSEGEVGDFQQFLQPNERVVVGHEMLAPILEAVRHSAGADDSSALARATYDWVVENLEYKKVGSGWGNGDTFWVCSERYGNCTDFHALFISLARTLGIPARFEIGFPIPEDRSGGEVGGYHCWVQFYLPETGWFPIDASEAFKHPEKRALFYGTHPADRIHFTTGRDLRLGDRHAGRTLNYFIYPHVEVGGVAYDGPIENSFSYRGLSPEMP